MKFLFTILIPAILLAGCRADVFPTLMPTSVASPSPIPGITPGEIVMTFSAVARELEEQHPWADILFIGALLHDNTDPGPRLTFITSIDGDVSDAAGYKFLDSQYGSTIAIVEQNPESIFADMVRYYYVSPDGARYRVDGA